MPTQSADHEIDLDRCRIHRVGSSTRADLVAGTRDQMTAIGYRRADLHHQRAELHVDGLPD